MKEDEIEKAYSIKERNRGLGCALVTGFVIGVVSAFGLYLIFG